LSRSYGKHWASRVMPQVLIELMRQESVCTTMRFYVGRNAQATADVLWQARERASNSFGNNFQKLELAAENAERHNSACSNDLKVRGAGGSRTHDGGFAIRCLSLLATAPNWTFSQRF
jgi:hypothetical protein